MNAYIIKPGTIPAMCHVITPDGTILDYVYISESKQPEASPITARIMPFSSLPLTIRATVNMHFGTMFSMAPDKRGAYLQSMVQWEVSTDCQDCNGTGFRYYGPLEHIAEAKDFDKCRTCNAAPCPFCGSTMGDTPSDDYPRCANCGAA